MLRLVLSLLLVVLLAATTAASAAHGGAHGVPSERHDAMSMDGDHDAHEAALAECCDAVGAQGGAGCLLDVTAPNAPIVLSGTAHILRALPADIISTRGVSTAVPTGPPKV
ncbi:hypothetical protein AAD018_010300 [Aestuariibius insulae]|uniref:hypothetical protein n=1 Tax=Aestuariibius insulae TaxID=2058287 RepID=UPI00345EFD90